MIAVLLLLVALVVGVALLVRAAWVLQTAAGPLHADLQEIVEALADAHRARATRVAALLETRGVGRVMLQDRLADRVKAGRS